MCDNFIANEDAAWKDVALGRIFLECLASSSSISSLSPLSSTSSEVSVSTLVDYIRDNASGDDWDESLLDELQGAVKEVALDGQVNWTLFKKVSQNLAKKGRRRRWQDGNNNIEKDYSNDDLLERSDDEKGSSGIVSGNRRGFGNLADHFRKPKTPRRFVTTDYVNLSNISSYSQSSDTTYGCAMSTDTTLESADDTDLGSGSCGEVAHVDLRLRVRRFDEENALLREELDHAEELSKGLQRQFGNLQRKLDHTNEKCRQVERENDELKENVRELEQKERDCRWALQKAEKERALLARQLEDAEAERQQIATLTTKLEACKRERLECKREAVVSRQELEEKQAECEMLKEKLAQIAESKSGLQESYEETIRCLREQNQDMKNQIVELHSNQNLDSLSDAICSTPPRSFLHLHPQSTPYSTNKNVDTQISLYSELKASGFEIADNANASRIRELEEELSWYTDEIREAIKEIDNIREKLIRHQRIPVVPETSMDQSPATQTADVYELLRKISRLSKAVNETVWKPKVKDAGSQIHVDSPTYDSQRIRSLYGILGFEDGLRLASENRKREGERKGEANEHRESGFFVEEFSMNSRLLSEYVDEVEVASRSESYREIDAFSPLEKGSATAGVAVQEHTIIDPIVEELDRILECTNQCEQRELPSKHPKSRGVYTCAEPPTDQRVTVINYSITDTTLDSSKTLENALAKTYVISSSGDGPLRGIFSDNSLANGGETSNQGESELKTGPREDSAMLDVDSLSELMLKTQNLELKENTQSESIDDNLNDKNSKTANLVPMSLSLTCTETSTPQRVSDSSDPEREDSVDSSRNNCSPPNKASRNIPKRKISVFHRSFDIDTLQATEATGGSDTYRVTERSLSTPDTKRENNADDKMELDLECMKMSPNTRNFLLGTYRTNAKDVDISMSPPSENSSDCHRQANSSVPVVPIRTSGRPIIQAPKFKLPLLKESILQGVDSKPKNLGCNGEADNGKMNNSLEKKVDDRSNAEVTAANKPRSPDGMWEVKKCEADLSESSRVSEMIRPGDEVDRGVTYRRGSFSRDTDFSSFSLLSLAEVSSTIDESKQAKPDNTSTVVPFSDEESTSCDSSPKRGPPLHQVSFLPLASTYEKTTSGERIYVRQEPRKPLGSWQSERSNEGIIGRTYKKVVNDSIGQRSVSSVGSYGGSGDGGKGGSGSAPDESVSAVPAVALGMSSGEDSSDSECDPMAIRSGDETRSISPVVLPFVNGAFLGSSTPAAEPNLKRDSPDERGNSGPRKLVAQNRDKRERHHTIRRSLSESGCGRSESSCHCTTVNSTPAEFDKDATRPRAFPSLTDARLQESGIANLSSSDEVGGNLSEADLERKCTALSLGLVTDRVTLPRRIALSIRQRDQSEINFASEVQKMHQDIQDLAPLCIDRESLERVERVRHQLEMISQCVHRVSCTAETLGAVHQEHRVSRALLLADRYLQILRSRCEKLASDLADTKRILTENNIVVEENNGELGDDLPRIRYRGMPTNNRTMDGLRQRNSVSGRVTLRRPSLSAESQKWEADKLDRTDSSSSSIGELREIFEQAESRRNSREENNNVLRLHSSSLSIRDCDNNEGDVWTCTREELIAESPPVNDGCPESRHGRRLSQSWIAHANVSWKPLFWCILISFFLGFYVKHVVSSVSGCSGTPFRWWSIQEFLESHLGLKHEPPRPI